MRTSCCTRSIWNMDDSSSVWAIMTPLVSPAAIRSRILQETGEQRAPRVDRGCACPQARKGMPPHLSSEGGPDVIEDSGDCLETL